MVLVKQKKLKIPKEFSISFASLKITSTQISPKFHTVCLLLSRMLPLSTETEEDDDESDEENEDTRKPKSKSSVSDEIKKSGSVDFANLSVSHNLGFLVDEKSPKQKTAPELSDMTHLRSVHFHGFGNLLALPFYEMSSFVESKMLKFGSKIPEVIASYTQPRIVRIYPKGKV